MTAEDAGDADERPAELFALDRTTCVTLLTTQHVGRLIIGGDEPMVIPLNYRAAGDAIRFRTEGGGRASASVGQAVAFEVDMIDARTRSGWSVVVRGRLDLAPDDSGDAADAADEVDTWAPAPRELRMVVTVDDVTGQLLRGRVDAPTHPLGGYL
jgi:nitroimidazol reductase NimA-like FMN-containing flavoprotein (pyridoxamine 5'-phosphate oxidase superfamily)